MKNKLLVFALASVTSISFAFTLEASLKKNMKQIGKLVKAVSKQIDDPSKNADSSAKISDVLELLKKSMEQMPESVEKKSKEAQEPAMKQYKELIEKEIQLSTELKKNFEANDNAKAAETLKEMNSIKKKGHKEFDPED